ncbi:hypothetical protein [Pseudomonas fluorescens]|uniref:Morphogenetic protein n=1 Tax=Pseudomonas fluorescens TaxID=294 RepID=A0A0D0NAP5_PSEFL|nr:hypothetical protein [Pseudomonas fluorescens]KIQ56456.1 hypothetical protein RL74_25945 [Pseudomonas fluorescens]
MSQVKERPILFSAPMVRAILEGRKTVTRRAVSPKLTSQFDEPRGQADVEAGYPFIECHNGFHSAALFCPYGQPGDRLWVRETWGVISHTWNEHGDMVDWVPDRPATAIRELPFGRGYYSGHVIYAADGPNEWAGDDDGGGEPRSAWHPSIHMPRRASRILLEVTDVRVERLQDISDEQALAEGAQQYGDGNGYHVEDGQFYTDHPYETFAGLWQSINGEESWRSNPWVWVVEFKRVQP